jgi:hypothetical protein
LPAPIVLLLSSSELCPTSWKRPYGLLSDALFFSILVEVETTAMAALKRLLLASLSEFKSPFNFVKLTPSFIPFGILDLSESRFSLN